MPSLSSSFLRCIAVVGACALGSGGCSYLFVDGPPQQHKQLPYFTCSRSKAWPVVDSVIGGVYGIAAVSAFAAGESNQAAIGSGVVAGGVAALFVASAISGFRDASECREATEELQVRLTRMHQGFSPSTPSASYDPWLRPMDKPFGTPSTPTPEGESTSPPVPVDER